VRRYSVRGLTGSTAAAGSLCIVQLWNNDATKILSIVELGCFKTGITAGNTWGIFRTTARGTPGSTVTPDGDNCWDGDAESPPSGALLDLGAFSAEPTRASPGYEGNRYAGGTGSAGAGGQFVWPEGIDLRPGTGLMLEKQGGNGYDASEVYAVWDEP
jgi:hypothetical protein